MTGEARVDEAGRRVCEQAEPAEAGLALQTGGDIVRQGDDLEGTRQDELAGMQHERIVRLDLDQAGEVRLLLGRVDNGVLVVVEQPEVPVDPDVDTGRLDHVQIQRIEDDAIRLKLGADVPIREQHPARLAARDATP